MNRPLLQCHGCGGVIVCARPIVDLGDIARRHAATCAGVVDLDAYIPPPFIEEPGRQRWGEVRAQAYARRLDALAYENRMGHPPPRRPA